MHPARHKGSEPAGSTPDMSKHANCASALKRSTDVKLSLIRIGAFFAAIFRG